MPGVKFPDHREESCRATGLEVEEEALNYSPRSIVYVVRSVGLWKLKNSFLSFTVVLTIL